METKNRIKLVDGKLIYSEENVYKDCNCNHSDNPKHIGMLLKYVKPCSNPECKNGKIDAVRGGKTIKKKCPVCNGYGYLRLDEPIIVGKCPICNATLKDWKVSKYDSATREDEELLYTLIDFDVKLKRENQTFNEEYLGLGIVAGITDYGRYLSLTPDEFKLEVKKHFVGRGNQYLHYMNKENEICDLIVIVKTQSGWSAYPIWNKKS